MLNAGAHRDVVSNEGKSAARPAADGDDAAPVCETGVTGVIAATWRSSQWTTGTAGVCRSSVNRHMDDHHWTILASPPRRASLWHWRGRRGGVRRGGAAIKVNKSDVGGKELPRCYRWRAAVAVATLASPTVHQHLHGKMYSLSYWNSLDVLIIFNFASVVEKNVSKFNSKNDHSQLALHSEV